MSRLFKFEIKRMKYKKIHIILPLIIISIGLVGIITGNAFEYSTHSEPHRPALRATHSII